MEVPLCVQVVQARGGILGPNEEGSLASNPILLWATELKSTYTVVLEVQLLSAQ